MTTKSKVPFLIIQNMMLKRMISYLRVKDILILLVSIFPFIKSYPLQIAETKSLALKGNIDAQIQLGVFYNKGVEKDYLEAYYWMKWLRSKDTRLHAAIWAELIFGGREQVKALILRSNGSYRQLIREIIWQCLK